MVDTKIKISANTKGHSNEEYWDLNDQNKSKFSLSNLPEAENSKADSDSNFVVISDTEESHEQLNLLVLNSLYGS
ncbi:hypothetical protein HZS_2283 [Henneguya salminicola]|nr:hypothetical protein HZS_2283 [Henneguya salminicola]